MRGRHRLSRKKMATRGKKAKTKSRYRKKFKTEWSAELTSRVSFTDICSHSLRNFCCINTLSYPILYTYFGICYCESEIKY